MSQENLANWMDSVKKDLAQEERPFFPRIPYNTTARFVVLRYEGSEDRTSQRGNEYVVMRFKVKDLANDEVYSMVLPSFVVEQYAEQLQKPLGFRLRMIDGRTRIE